MSLSNTLPPFNSKLAKIPKMAREMKGSFFKGTPRNKSSGDRVGPVAQRIRARGYEPQCQGFESLFTHNLRAFTFGVGKL